MKTEGRKTNDDWKTVTLGGIFDIARGGSPRPIDSFITDDPDGVNWIMISDATSKYITSTKKRIIKEGMKKSREVHPGDFLLTNSMSFGRPYIMQTSGCIHDGWLVLSPRGGVAHPDYFYHLLGSDVLYAEFERRAAGATVKNLNIELVKGVEVLLPSLAEQRRIAEVLDRAEALRAKRRAALSQLDSLTQSLFHDLFGDPATNPKGWPLVRLGEQTKKIGSGSTPTGGETAYRAEGISLIRSLNVRDGEFTFKDLAHIGDEQAAKLAGVIVEENDVLLNITGASVARVCRAPLSVLPARVNQHVCIIRPKPILNAIFLEQFLLAEQTKRRLLKIGGAGATREAITKAQIEVFEAICPPIPLQLEFARRVTAMEALKTAQRASLAELDALFATLQHRAFRGEL